MKSLKVMGLILGSAIVSGSAFADCGYVYENNVYVWRCDPEPGSNSCRYIYQCHGSTTNGCEYVWDPAALRYVYRCGNGSSDCQYIWQCGG